jgi:hypothetical protein
LSKPAAMASFIGACVRPARAQSLILVKARRVADAQGRSRAKPRLYHS